MQPDIRRQMVKEHVDELIRDADRYRLTASLRRADDRAIARKHAWARWLLDRPAIAR